MSTKICIFNQDGKWRVVYDYGHRGGMGRQGAWCDEMPGDHGFSWCTHHDIFEVVRQAFRPVGYKTRREALKSVEHERGCETLYLCGRTDTWITVDRDQDDDDWADAYDGDQE